MKEVTRRFQSLIGEGGRSWVFRSVLFILLALGVSWGLEWILRWSAERDWERFANGQANSYLEEARADVAELQRSSRRIAAEIAVDQDLLQSLLVTPPDRTRLFTTVSHYTDMYGVGVEVYDVRGSRMAWSGRSGAPQEKSVGLALSGRMTSSVVRTPTEAELNVVVPIRSGSGIEGAILVRRLIESNAPFANRFSPAIGLSGTLEQRLGVPLEFSFAENAELSRDGRYASAVLYGIDSTKLGTVSVMRPARGEYFERLSSRFQVVNTILQSILLFLLGFGAWLFIRQCSSPWLRIGAVTAIIWAVRYLLLYLEIPSGVMSGALFDPTMFASQFGGGLAKSIGEFSVTVLLVATNAMFLTGTLMSLPRRQRVLSFRRSALLGFLSGIPLAILLFWGLRGYAATVQSTVFDSSLEYLNPRQLLPTPELTVMVLNLLFLGISFIAISCGLVRSLSVFAGLGSERRRTYLVRVIYAALFLSAAIGFGLVGSVPLTSLGHRLIVGAGLLLLVMMVDRALAREDRWYSARVVNVALVLSAILLYPLLSDFTKQHDRRRVETLTQEVLRPVDSWFSLVVEDALVSFASEDAARTLESGDEYDRGRIAFTRWAQSPACREGYTAIFTCFSPQGTRISRFAIGGQLGAATEVDTSLVQDNVREVTVKEIGRGINAVKVYAGYTDIRAADDRLLGFGQVTIAAGQQTLFRGETPMILRAGSTASLQSFYRTVTIAEFKAGHVQPGGQGIYPIGAALPPGVAERLANPAGGAVWNEDRQDTDLYETAFFRRPGTADEVLAISVMESGFAGHVLGIVKVLLHVAILGLVFMVGRLIPGWIRERRLSFTFRGRLLAAMLITALIPLAVLTWYGSQYTAERLLDESTRTLDDETGTVASYIADQMAAAAGSDVKLNQTGVEAIAAEINTDFSVYMNGLLTATSRPELFDLGILDRRLSGRAYAALVLQGRAFVVEREKIAQGEYAVGYRPLVDSTGNVAAIISVPTLFRQERIEKEGTRRNAILFGVYIVLLLGVVLLAATLANRIAAPIQQLTAATKQVAGGDLDVRVEVPNADGELRELIDSFDAMTLDLKTSRDNLVRFERELAWREMAKQVAHEIKNPLTPMRLSVQHLRQAFRDKARNFEDILDTVSRTMIEQIDTLSRIASEFSHFARMPRRQLVQCEVNDLLRESVELFQHDRNVRFSFSLADGLPSVVGDKEEVRRAFINIIRNGIQAMEEKGRIDIVTGATEGGIRITIRDQGKGIPGEMREKLFQPNFSTKTDGMGLGLAIVKKTFDDMGGTVALEPAEGGGTAAIIFIPAGGVRT
jgi:two-component system, NtrC family, nitrogen regulation sensor histidine kinase NtrY